MRHRKTNRRARRRGAAVVETAVALPLLILLVLGVAELSWYIHCAHALHSAARQGARAAVYHGNSNAEVEAAVRSSVTHSTGLDAGAVHVRISALTSTGEEQYQVQNLNDNEQGVAIRVTASVDYGRIGLATNMLGMKGKQLSGQAVMRRRK